jgi:hypothetical protein
MATETRTAPDDPTVRQDHLPAPIDAPPRGRRGMPAGHVFVAMLVCLLLWGILYGPELQRSAEAQPQGVRRSVALAILAPVVWISDRVFLTDATDAAARGLGRDPGEAIGGEAGAIPVEIDDLPTFRPPAEDPDAGQGGGRIKRDTDIRVPTGRDRLRIAVVGDSLANGIGFYAERVFKPFFTEVVKQGRISTGLARPDYFNWPRQMEAIVDRFRPDLTIVMLGENDAQSLQTSGGGIEVPSGTAEWPTVYEARVERFAKIASARGGHVIWVGMPISRDESRWTHNQRLNGIYERVADRLPNVAFFDTWEAFSKDGGYTAYYRDGSHVKLIRTDDGIHFNGDGYTILMENVARFTTEEFDLDPKTYET